MGPGEQVVLESKSPSLAVPASRGPAVSLGGQLCASPRVCSTTCLSALRQRDLPAVEGVYYRYWEDNDLIHSAPAHYGYRTELHKLIYYYNDGMGLPFTLSFYTHPPARERYDLENDPDEVNNVYNDPEYREIREEQKAAMWREQARLGDAPHPSQPVPAGCEDVAVAPQPDIPRIPWLNPPGVPHE